VGDVALLALLGQGNRLIQVLLLDRPRKLRRELPGFGLGALELDELLDHDGQRPDGHDRQNGHDALGEEAHRVEQLKKIYAHFAMPPGGTKATAA
jgi:hypothetical protein